VVSYVYIYRYIYIYIYIGIYPLVSIYIWIESNILESMYKWICINGINDALSLDRLDMEGWLFIARSRLVLLDLRLPK